MNMPPHFRVHPSGVAFDGAADQAARSIRMQQSGDEVKADLQLPQAQAAAGEMAQAQLATGSQQELMAAQLLNQAKASLQQRALQLDPQNLGGTRAMAELTNRLGSADPAAIAAAIGMRA